MKKKKYYPLHRVEIIEDNSAKKKEIKKLKDSLAYTEGIRSRTFKELESKLEASEKKGKNLCVALGLAFIEIHDLKNRLSSSWAKKSVDDIAVIIERISNLGGSDSAELAAALIKEFNKSIS